MFVYMKYETLKRTHFYSRAGIPYELPIKCTLISIQPLPHLRRHFHSNGISFPNETQHTFLTANTCELHIQSNETNTLNIHGWCCIYRYIFHGSNFSKWVRNYKFSIEMKSVDMCFFFGMKIIEKKLSHEYLNFLFWHKNHSQFVILLSKKADSRHSTTSNVICECNETLK